MCCVSFHVLGFYAASWETRALPLAFGDVGEVVGGLGKRRRRRNTKTPGYPQQKEAMATNSTNTRGPSVGALHDGSSKGASRSPDKGPAPGPGTSKQTCEAQARNDETRWVASDDVRCAFQKTRPGSTNTKHIVGCLRHRAKPPHPNTIKHLGRAKDARVHIRIALAPFPRARPACETHQYRTARHPELERQTTIGCAL